MKVASLIFAATLVTAPSLAFGQTEAPSAAAQALSACVAQHTTSADDIALMRWMFASIARHPSVSQLASIPDAERVEINRQMGSLFNRLFFDSCENEMRAAFRSDGSHALDLAFQDFGGRAMTDLMGNADVSAGMSEVGAYIDNQRLSALQGPAAQHQ